MNDFQDTGVSFEEYVNAGAPKWGRTPYDIVWWALMLVGTAAVVTAVGCFGWAAVDTAVLDGSESQAIETTLAVSGMTLILCLTLAVFIWSAAMTFHELKRKYSNPDGGWVGELGRLIFVVVCGIALLTIVTGWWVAGL